ncbi:MAG TPA: zf-HC2 domain-containing protein [Candidatus Limnocylindria bacterium]|nr:zf-HC2 domain-containing protein [Candidatus Limnocylindria bacterium]
MTQPGNRPGQHPDELLSASLSGDLTGAERTALDAHLAGCQECTRTLADFRRGRELLGAMRHVEPPRDMPARVYAAVDAPRAPWWRRPSTMVAALATGATMVAALLAVLTFNDLRQPEVGNVTPSPTAVVSMTPVPPAETPSAVVSPSEAPLPTPLEVAAHFRSSLEQQDASLEIVTPRGTKDLLDTAALPVSSAVSPDGTWIAFRVEGESSGIAQTYVTGDSGNEIHDLGRSVAPSSGVGGELAWSPDGRYLAYTLTSMQDGGSDAWLFDTTSSNVQQVTGTGDSFAASWVPSTDGPMQLWISRASAQPVSFLVEIPVDGPPAQPVDPAQVAVQTVEGVFGPLVAPDGQKVIFWTGSMANLDGRWVFQPGTPMLGEADEAGALDFSGRPLFSSLTVVGGEAFAAAQIAWGPDSDAFAVWNAEWTGIQQPDGFPARDRVYFGHVSVPELITPRQALDAADLEGVQQVIDVVIAPDGMKLAVTVQTASGSEGGEFGAEAEIRVIDRGLGEVPDQVTVLKDAGSWNGPAVFDEWDG